MNTIDFSGIKVDNVTLTEAAEIVRHFIIEGKPRLIVTPNPEIIVAAQDDHELREILNSADLRVPDGISMVVVSRILGHPLKERVCGIDLMLRLLEIGSNYNYRVFLLGSFPGVADLAAKNLKEKFPGIQIVGTHHGYFSTEEEPEVINKIRTAKPDLLFAGLGAGKQEKWLSYHLNQLLATIGMGIGGSLDVLSGRKKRAPKWIQDLYIEWLYRLITEPQRWKRQLALLKFLYLVFGGKLIYNSHK